MSTKSLPIFFLLIVMLLSACVSVATPAVEDASVPSVTETTVGVDEAGPYPLSTRTGIADIDVVLDAVESNDQQRIRELLRFSNVPCTTADGLGGPPKCRENESDGTLVEVFPFLGSEGGYLHKENLDLWTGIDVDQLYAIYRNSDDVYSDANFPAGEYAILFLSGDDFPGTSLQVAGGQIVRIDTLFDTSPAGLMNILNRDASELILPPK